ncbi:DNA repair protein RecO [Alkalicaulis satelles]|uniref:DNA repair protein RecO n=1 Tax=Alkalicaulis satelles TaxID=2609175 RepID=A0A5M6ZLS3_9PROT|nr:DNA repair protein RecO [Alkalicaulis satelles]KAA5804875.1 DNA repair protein RecO [Alkalicaulis satelles]
MEWTASGRILAVRPHGETSAVVEVLTTEHGRHAGLVRGGRSRALRPVLQPGNKVRAVWRARLEEHLGALTIEPEELSAGAIMEDALALSGLNALCAMASLCLPEREPHPNVAGAFELVAEQLSEPDVWPALYVRWELGVLADLGYGLDLRRCAATGATENLVYVSPKSGRAVSAEGGAPWKDKMLALPGFLTGSGALAPGDIAAGLRLSAHFLDRRVLWPADKRLPDARARMIERLEAAGRL